MSTNPYAPAISDVTSKTEAVRLYSPTQAACGTIGGPVGLIYFLWANFSALGKDRYARNTLIAGVVGLIGLIALVPFLPDKGTNTIFTVLYIVTARNVAEKYQMSKTAIANTPGYAFHSNGRVFWLGLLCLLVSFIVVAVPLMVLDALGVLHL